MPSRNKSHLENEQRTQATRESEKDRVRTNKGKSEQPIARRLRLLSAAAALQFRFDRPSDQMSAFASYEG